MSITVSITGGRMNLSRIKSLGRRLAVGATAAVAAVAMMATPAHASTDYLSDAASYGWASTYITWPGSLFQVQYNVNVGDNVYDLYCAEAKLAFYGYSGNFLREVSHKYCHAGGSQSFSDTPSFGANSVYAVSLQLCRFDQYNVSWPCQSKMYAYR
jgi:hypothetical protein